MSVLVQPHSSDKFADNQPAATLASGCDIELADTTRRLAPAVLQSLQVLTDQALRELAHHPKGGPIRGGALRVKLVGDAAMSAAHRQHSGIDGPTDILTFDLRSVPDSPLDTDLLIDLDEAERQSTQRHHPVGSELLLYVVHGVLHCLGFDDHDDRQYEEMHALEDQVLAAIGVGAVFAREQEGGT